MAGYWGGRGNCPKCGKFCGDIQGEGNEMRGLLGCFFEYRVTGICKTHGEVDLSYQAWAWEDFFDETD